ncbi:MAG TPA: radical SAM protein [Candidatus Limnocylindrales bacterium]|nr:radical SAM protein [Candidatus Limnocylindrales bacterium]
MDALTKFDARHCHKWAQLLLRRQQKLNQALIAINEGNSNLAKSLYSQIFIGVNGGPQADPGMAGSLLYHMAMINKMESETRMLVNETSIEEPNVTQDLKRIYSDFESDAKELTKEIMPVSLDFQAPASSASLSSAKKIDLFMKLKSEGKKVEALLDSKSSEASAALNKLFLDWTTQIVHMRLTQEYETLRSLLVFAKLEESVGMSALEDAMQRVQDRFGQETVDIALNVTLKVGMRRERLQSVMLSDHFINYSMNVETLDGHMEFMNCPIFGSRKYMQEKYGVNPEASSLFCAHFCFAHARAMLDTVLPFPFTLWQPKRLGSHGNCEYYLKLAYSPLAKTEERFVPLVLSWNITRECNLKCSHCYINATDKKLDNELNTQESKNLMDQICQVSRPLLILSGGEPLLRPDIFDLIKHGSKIGLKMGLGSNGSLIDDATAAKLKGAGIATVSISIDSNVPEQHDEFRGVPGAWEKAVEACKALRRNNVLVQVNTTLTQQNYSQIDDIMALAESIGVENFHLFFLVPTGRGTKLTDLSPEQYETMITETFAKTANHTLNVRPSCAPQFMRIARDMGLDMRQWIRGCIAGLYYCRIYPNGDVTPCPYLPIKLGNVRDKSFKDIWFNSEVFNALRDPNSLKGKCGACEYRTLCGGCRARAYGLSNDFIDYCGDLHEPTELKRDYLTEDPWCVYQPKNGSHKP